MFKLIFLFCKKTDFYIEAIVDYESPFWVNIALNCKKPSRADQKGFVLIFMSVFLVVALLLGLVFMSSLVVLQNKMRTTHQCRIETLKIQELARPYLEKLFSLNPLAQTLRIQKRMVEIQLAAALATFNKPLVATLLIKRRSIIAQQKALDRTQKILIASANGTLKKEGLGAHYNLQRQLETLARSQRLWAETEVKMLPPKIPKLAVRPSDRLRAPIYVPKKNFESLQAVSLFWIQKYKLKNFLKIYGYSTQLIKNQCHATLEEETWIPKIRKDRRL